METEREEEGRHGNVLFDPPSLALGELPLLATAQGDGQISLLALSGVCMCVCVCTLGERTVKTLPLTNAAQVEVKGAENKYTQTQTYVRMKECSHYAGMQMQTYSL